ncbi:hypothetical protein GCM10027403_00570 [Arthrobacter tecti]
MAIENRFRLSLLIPAPVRTLLILFSIYLLSMAYPLLVQQQNWLGWFPATMSSFLLSTVFGSLTVCTSAAWLAGSVRRSGLSEWVAASARGVRGAYSRPILYCASLACLAYSIIFAAMFAMTLTRAPEHGALHPPMLLVLPIAWASAVAWAALGATFGRYLRSEAAIPLALIVSYASYVVPAFYLWDSPFFGVMLADGRPWLYLQPEDLQLSAKLLFWCGLAVAVAAIAMSRRRMLAIGATVSFAALMMTALLGSTLTHIPDAENQVCMGEAPIVCTDRAHAAVLPQFQRLASHSLTVIPEALRPRKLDSAGATDPGALPVEPMDSNTSPALTIDRELTLAALGEQIFYQCSAPGTRTGLAAAGLYAWWRIEQGIGLQEMVTFTGAPWLLDPELAEAPRMGQELAALTPRERKAWFKQNAESIRTCALEDVEWP